MRLTPFDPTPHTPYHRVVSGDMLGKNLSHYRIVEQIGAGGMGVVFLAHDEQLERDVAIKVLPPGILADEASRKRFRKEALSLAKLNHPNIATIHDFDSADETDFLVTEYIAGESLDKEARRGRIAIERSGPPGPATGPGPGRRARAGHHPSRSEAGQPSPDY